MATTTITIPSVLRVLVALRQWTAEENELCTFVMGEQVTNLQFLAVLMVAVGLMMTFFIMAHPMVGFSGIAMMYLGSVVLERSEGKEEGVC